MAGNMLPPGSNEALVHQQPAAPPAPYDPAGALAEPGSGGGLSIGRIFSAIRRFRWLIIIIVLAGTGVGMVATHFIKPVYNVTSTIWIRSAENQREPNQGKGIVEGQNWVELLTTNVVLDTVVVKEKLYLEPKSVEDTTLFKGFEGQWPWRPGEYVLQMSQDGSTYVLKDKAGITLETGRAGQPIGAKIGMRWQPSTRLLGRDRKIEFSLVTPRDASKALAMNLVSNLAQDGSFLRISLSGNDPARLTRTLNLVDTQFVKVAGDLKNKEITAQAKSLEEQLATVGQQLKEADGRLESYKAATITKPSEGTAVSPATGITQNTVMTDYFQKRVELDQIKNDQQRLADALQKARNGQKITDELQTIPSVLKAPELNRSLAALGTAEQELEALNFRYTPQSPNVQQAQAKVDTLRQQVVPTYINALSNALKAQEMALSSQINQASAEIRQIPGRMITEQQLTRDRDILAQMFANIQLQYQNARLMEASSTPDVQVLDPAVPPQRPSSNSAIMLVLAAFAISLGLALGLAVLLDRLDKRFRYPEQVTRELGLSILGAVPAIRQVRGEQSPEEAAQVVEAFRTIRMNIAHAYGAAGPVMLTVSSPSPGDGKSLVSSNLALSFAEAGYRTLLIDGDIRRGELHRMFSIDRRPGLLDHLSGQAGLDNVLRPTTHQNLSVIACGTRHHHGPELLGSAAMRDMMAALKSRFNVIIVDSPPLGAGIDPFVLGTATGNMLLVLRSGETEREMAENQLKLMDRLPIRLLGAVLNSVNTSDNAYKYYRYVYGYTADEEPAQLGTAS
ncbi:MAG TPA: polysaccharide biosynthesis tyrosine autokinase [Gemmatimonadales bacterium]|jgi:capsular exopolysaccharide synthesis family protein|nr:polysaccharide biosynthesis tyrosine autokinase [Gemmatimonadales bacterium]